MPKSDQGVSIERYQVIPRTLIFITRGEHVLLLLGAPTKRLWANRYNGIGGHIEHGEDVLSSARRELDEEAGLHSEDLRLMGTIMVDVSQTVGIAIYVFRGSSQQGEARASEEGQLVWVRQDDLDTLPLVEDLKILLPKVLAAKLDDAPFSARSYYDEQERLQVVWG